MNYKAIKLDESQTRKAKHFLYHIYADHLGWLPKDDNPSGWVTMHDADGPYFDDIFNRYATWFAVYNENEIIASGRLVRPVDGKLELELYNRLPGSILSAGRERVEMNRLAILPKYNGSGVLGLLFRQMFMFAKASGINFIITGAPESTIGIVKDLLFETVNTFKYSESDSGLVYCSMLDMSRTADIENMLKTLPEKRYTLRFF